MDIYFAAGNLVIAAAAVWFVLRFNLHMFQQNGYKPKEHGNWLLHNRDRQRVLLPAFLLQVLAGAWLHPVTAVLSVVGSALCLWYYLSLARQRAKKRLVYTDRVKRLIATNVLLVLLLFLCVFLSKSLMFSYFATGLVLIAEPFLILFANLCNAPMEGAVRRHYSNDAKRMLARQKGLTVIGVTGSYGKTSVKFYLNALLQTKYQVLMTPESYNTPMGVVKTIRTMLNPTHEIFICEMGAKNVGDIKELCELVHPKHGVITAIGPQHLESFHTMDNIVKTKFELADALPSDGILFLNGDNAYIREQKRTQTTVYYGSETGNDGAGCAYRASDMKVSALGTSFRVTTEDGESEEFQTKLIGAHNVGNIVGAIAVAHRLGIPLASLQLPVRRLQPVEHRLALIERGGVTIIDDAYNSNPIGSKAAVETLALFDGLRILVTPGMIELGEKEEEYNYEFGKLAASCCDYIALVGRKRTEPIANGAKAAGFPEEHLFVGDRLEDAIGFAYTIAGEKHKFILLENDLPDNYS